MQRVKSFLILLLPILFVSFLVMNSYARQLTPSERSKYAQNNIIFYVPCDTEEDCTQDIPSAPDPNTDGVPEIVEFAMKSSWPNEEGKCLDNVGENNYVNWDLDNPTPYPAGCRQTINDFAKSYGKTVGQLRDCGRFVGFVLQNTVDPDAPYGGTVSFSNHMDRNPDKWTKVSTPGVELPMSELKPGDILVYSGGSGAASGHIMIYIGDHEVNCGGGSKCSVNIAEASTNLDNNGVANPEGGRTPFMRKITNTLYGRNKATPYNVYRYTANSGSSSSSGNEGNTTVVSGPEGINISTQVIKPCPAEVQSTRSGATYNYTVNGISYKVANTKLDLASYVSYLKKHHIAQDGKTCDPESGKCYTDTNYDDYGLCLSFAGVHVGNLMSGNCVATDHGAGEGAGSISQEPHTSNSDKENGRRPILQKIYDAIMSGKAVLVKVASKTTNGVFRHFAAAVGVRANANRASLVDSDILYLDTDGNLKNTRELYFQLEKGGGYWIRIP